VRTPGIPRSVAWTALLLMGCLSSDTERPVLGGPWSDAAPDSTFTLIVATRASDCLTCSLFDAFGAFRYARSCTQAGLLSAIVVVISDDERDTLPVHNALHRERLAGRLYLTSPRVAHRVFGPSVPSVRLVRGQQVIRQWLPSGPDGSIKMSRTAVLDALAGAIVEYPNAGGARSGAQCTR
jgi:hypothetical protein